MSTDLIHIRSECEEVIHGYTRERAVNTLGVIADYKRLLREMEDQVWAAMQADVEANGPIELGTRRWYMAPKKDIEPKPLEQAFAVLLEACGGDWTRFVCVLSKNAMKPGAVRELLKEAGMESRFSEVFSEETVTELREGKAVPVKELREVDTRYSNRP